MSAGRGKTSKLSSPPLPFYHNIKRVICRPFSLTGQNNNETWPPPHVATDTYALLNKMDADVHVYDLYTKYFGVFEACKLAS